MKKTLEKPLAPDLYRYLPSIRRRQFLRLTAGASAAMLTACGGGSGNGNAAPNKPQALGSTSTDVAATLTIQQQPVPNSVTLDPGFASLSYEKSHISTSPGVYFGANNTNLIGLLNALGGGVLRIGANSVDRMTWTPAGAGQVGNQVSQIDVARFAGFIKQCPNWKVIYGINFAGAQNSQSSPALAAAEAAYAAQQLGSQLLAFEIGNEPDLYGNDNTPNLSGMTYSTFINGGSVGQGTIAGWNQFAQAIRSAVSGAVFSGPAASSDKSGWAEDFAASETGSIALMTEHYYISNYDNAAPSIAGMLTYPDTNLVLKLQALQTAAQKNATLFRMGESNSYFSSADPAGVSNAFASALWAIDFVFTHAQYGASGLNLHNNGTIAGYTAIGDAGGAVTAVQPLYYALAFFAQIFAGGTTGKLLNSNLTAKGIALSAYAVGVADGATYVIVNNKDTTYASNVTIAIGKTASQAQVTTLASSGANPTLQLENLGAYSGGSAITFGGQPIGLNGAWQGAAQQTVAVSGQSVTLNVAAASAALIRIV
ncbi:hypothetical protein PQQ51_08445 [Paraburkholderia xenovorans]|uniref:hypothetical protein n=1 Tax=Paraburkholderia xenovorans TaxID=36873 RepID=UPI0038B723D5